MQNLSKLDKKSVEADLKKDANAKVLDNGNMLIDMPVKIVLKIGRNRILSLKMFTIWKTAI